MHGRSCYRFWAIFRASPDTALERHWGTTSLISVLAATVLIQNLVPIPKTDGYMLLHLMLGTRQGDDLIAVLLTSANLLEASFFADRADFESEFEVRRKVAESAYSHGETDMLEFAVQNSQLGRAYRTDRLSEAETVLLRTFNVPFPLKEVLAVLAASAWTTLSDVYRQSGSLKEMRRAHWNALEAFLKAE